MSFVSIQEMLDAASSQNLPLWKVIQLEDCNESNIDSTESFEKMRHMYQAMKEADRAYDGSLRSASGLAGGDGLKLEEYRLNPNRLIGDYLAMVMEKAVKMGESNACMRRIVAAPTAGSCGVLPAVLISYEEYRKAHPSAAEFILSNADLENRIVESLFIAAGLGSVLAATASIAGAEGGCQAEIGSASAMAAAAITYLEGGDNEAIVHAASLAIKNMLGLTCDPVAGLVEVPCIKRNVSGAVNAVMTSQMALAGVRSQIPPDEVIDSMRRIGHLIPGCLRETGEEGLAITPTAQAVVRKITS